MPYPPQGYVMSSGRLSNLLIDVNKNWQAKEITNLKAVASGMEHGAVPFRGASIMEVLAASIHPNEFLKSGGVAANPLWETPAGMLPNERKRFDLLIEDAVVPAAGGAESAQVDGTNFSYWVLNFDAAAEEEAYWVWTLPEDFDPDRDILVDIWWKSTLTSGDVKWSVRMQGRTVCDPWDAALGNLYVKQQAPHATANNLSRASLRITPVELDGKDVAIIKLTRPVLAGHAADATVVAVAVFYGTKGQSKQTFFPLPAPVEVLKSQLAPEDYGTWKTLNVRSLCKLPEFATGIIFHLVHPYGGAMSDFGIRKTGSTDTRKWPVDRETHQWGMVGVSTAGNIDVFAEYENRLFELWIAGYTIGGVTFLTNGVNLSPTGIGAWETVDASGQAPNACGLIFEVVTSGVGADRAAGARMTGSTDSRTEIVANHGWMVIGCNAAQEVDLYKGGPNTMLFLMGYILDGAAFLTNAADHSLTGTGVWTDITTVAGAIFVFIEGRNTGIPYQWGLRKNDSSEEILYDLCYHYWGIIEADADGKIEGRIENVAVDFFRVGIATPNV